MNEKTGEGQSGGINVSGQVGDVGGDIVGRDKLVFTPQRKTQKERSYINLLLFWKIVAL
jgi:hypothetical protein